MTRLIPNLFILSKLSCNNFTPLLTIVTADAKPFPNAVAIFSITSWLFFKATSNAPNSFFKAPIKLSATTFLKLNILSPIIDIVPTKVCANSSVAFPNLPPLPKTLSNASAVSLAVTVAPALKPSKSLTPLSLNISALATPALNDLCICSAVVLKSKPVTDATLPVISNILFNSSASLLTTAKFPDACCI